MRVAARLNFLFSVYDVPEQGETHIFYRGSVTGSVPTEKGGAFEARLFDSAEIPWNDFTLPQTRSMLRRFVREQAADSFGIYMDGFGSRRVAKLSGAPEEWRTENDSLARRSFSS